jgi:YHS domain-containing protein
MPWTHIRLIAIIAVLFAGLNGTVAIAADKVYSDWLGRAIKGYDAVAYHTMGKPVEGDSDFEYEWMGGTWRFASAENRELFKANPEKYAPQYGGYCAYGVSQGYLVKIEPDAWSIVDGKLYLNYSQSVQATWNEDRQGFIDTADKRWPQLVKE